MALVVLMVISFVRLGNPPADPHVADFNSSFSVDLLDLASFCNQFGAGLDDPLVPEIPVRPADLDAEGDIDWHDLALFAAAMTGPPRPIPCTSNADCEDHNPCSFDFCNGLSLCEYDKQGSCCLNDFQCNDRDPCTTVCRPILEGLLPTCTTAIRSCCFFAEHCNDGDPCSDDMCGNENQCHHSTLVPCCGNKVLEEGEQCDDGNTTAGDGCGANCHVEWPDACDMAPAIHDGQTAFSNAGSTTDGPSCEGMAADVWYDYTAPCTGTVFVDTFGSKFDTVLAVYEGCACLDEPLSDCCSAHETPGCGDEGCQEFICSFDAVCCEVVWDAQCAGEAAAFCGICPPWPALIVACNDDADSEQSAVNFLALAGNCYKLQVGGHAGAQGSGTIQIDAACCGDGDVDPGEDCETDADCADHPGGPRCAGCACTCLNLQEACTFETDCCEATAFCEQTSCTGDSVCCLPLGAFCPSGQSCDCCGKAECVESACCIPAGGSCFSEFDCCGGPGFSAGGGGGARCDNGTCCRAGGSDCSVDWECCEGISCNAGTCCNNTKGAPCQEDADCCWSNFLVCRNGTCEET